MTSLIRNVHYYFTMYIKTPWWHFWNPCSGGFGGMIAGAIVYTIIKLLQ